jgi:small subunit ribosomal protein S3
MAGERKFVRDNVKRALLKEYLKEQVKRAGFGGVDIQRTPMGTRVTLVTERPGLVIGRKGSSIKALTDAIEFEFGFDKPQVEVVEVDNPNLSAQIMAEKLASALERGWHFRRAGHSTVRRIMDAGARGCQVIISGKLTGQRHRTEKFKEGHIKFCGEPKLQWMEEGYTPAKLKPGIIGVKVQIMHPEAKLPDEVSVTLKEHLKMDDKPVPAQTQPEEGEEKDETPEDLDEKKNRADEEPEKKGETPKGVMKKALVDEKGAKHEELKKDEDARPEVEVKPPVEERAKEKKKAEKPADMKESDLRGRRTKEPEKTERPVEKKKVEPKLKEAPDEKKPEPKEVKRKEKASESKKVKENEQVKEETEKSKQEETMDGTSEAE